MTGSGLPVFSEKDVAFVIETKDAGRELAGYSGPAGKSLNFRTDIFLIFNKRRLFAFDG